MTNTPTEGIQYFLDDSKERLSNVVGFDAFIGNVLTMTRKEREQAMIAPVKVEGGAMVGLGPVIGDHSDTEKIQIDDYNDASRIIREATLSVPTGQHKVFILAFNEGGYDQNDEYTELALTVYPSALDKAGIIQGTRSKIDTLIPGVLDPDVSAEDLAAQS